MRNNVPDFDLKLDAIGSYYKGGSLANQMIENMLRRQQLEQSNRQVTLQEQASQREVQQQQAQQKLFQEAEGNYDKVMPILYANNPKAAAELDEKYLKPKFSAKFDAVNTVLKADAKNKQATYDLMKPELQKQFPDWEFGDSWSNDLGNRLDEQRRILRGRLNSSNQLQETAQGLATFNPQTRELIPTGIGNAPTSGSMAPAATREFEYYKSLSPQQQKEYLNVKRSTIDKGTTFDENGNIIPIPGAAPAKEQFKQSEKLGTDLGEAQAKAMAGLGNTEDNSYFLLNQLEALGNHPGLKGAVGIKGGGALFGDIGSKKIVPGSQEADFIARMNQVEGQAFLQAFDTLRGGGQITEKEGEKATQARLRMSKATSEKEFLNSRNEFVDVVKTGLERQRRQAKGEFGTKIKGGQSADKTTLLPNQSAPNKQVIKWGDL